MTKNKTEAGWMDPVATKLETMQFNCFHVSSADAEKLSQLPVGAKLYTSPPNVAEVIAPSEDSRLMDEYMKLQRDHERQAKTIERLTRERNNERDAAQVMYEALMISRAQLAEKSAEVETIETLARERGELHQIVRDCLAALSNGSGATEECSIQFLREAPKEIKSEVERLRGYQKDAGRYRKWKWHFREGMCELFNALNKSSTDEEHDAAIDAARAEIGSGST